MDRSNFVVETQKSVEELNEQKIQENIANWQSGEAPLTSLTDEQLDAIYKIKDLIDEYYYPEPLKEEAPEASVIEYKEIPTIHSYQEYIKWMVAVENEMKSDNLKDYVVFFNRLNNQTKKCELLYNATDTTLKAVQQLQTEYSNVTAKTDSLHSLSEQLMRNQKELKDKKAQIQERLCYFRTINSISDSIDSNNIGSEAFLEALDRLDECLKYFLSYPNFKESKAYIIKSENLLSKAVILIRKHFNDVITAAMTQITDPDNKVLLTDEKSFGESAFSLYYGKFQLVAVKVKSIVNHIEDKVAVQNRYKQLLNDCHQIYFAQRSPVITDAVAKALIELRNKHKNDHSVLFRSSALFIMQICQDEASCFKYFFTNPSEQLHEYFGILCQHLYDMLRPCLIGIYHLEVLTELCGIFRREMLNDQILSNEILDKFVEIIRQLLQDMEERLVFRAHIFFHNDLRGYQPSPGDLAYPEKLEQMENITEEFDFRTESRSSIASLESQEVARATQLGQFYSHTGNSPADLHGMWYPTVKRTLVCLSRLYFCLEREIFQGLAQEALAICVETIDKAQGLISARKSPIDGRLFQIKHLLILREQIAPFQVDFTVKEVSLDFSNIKLAAVGLINNRDKLFTFSGNNALLEFLLEGTPRVKEYLVDSRKEIDKQLKVSCEAFITCATSLLIGHLNQWIQKVVNGPLNDIPLREHEFGRSQVLAVIISGAQKNIKTKVPEIQRSMQLYIANRETEFILFKPIRNNVINMFSQIEQVLISTNYTQDDQLVISCPTPEQVNVLLCSVSLTSEQDFVNRRKISVSSISSIKRDKTESSSVQPDLHSTKDTS